MQGISDILSRSYIARYIFAALAQALVIWISLHMVPVAGAGPSLVWPPAAVGLAILLFWGLDLWPAIATAFFIVLLFRDVAPPLIATTALANTLESLMAAYILKYYVDFSPMLSRLRDTLGLIFAALFASVVSASIITIGVFVFNHRPALNAALWMGIWIGHLVSIISFGPFVLRWLVRPLFTKSSEEVVEGVTVFGLIATLSILIFWTNYSSVGGISLLYILIAPLIWAALRTGPRGMGLALFLLATIGATGTLFGYGTLAASANLSQVLFGVQVLIGVLAIIFLLFTSITEERKEAVNQLQSHVGQLEVALQKISYEDQAKTDFIAILAHELRNPLSPILSGLELLKASGQAPEDILRMMGAHLHTIARLLDDLLDISRISQKKFKLQKESIDVRTVISHALEMVQPQLENRGHSLITDIPQEELWLNADPVRLAQVFANLLTNSAKYTNPNGKIELRVVRKDGKVLVSVADNGIGIERARLSQVFEPFGGAEQQERRPAGLRIGLSLAKRMVEMHQGTIEVQSAGSGKGTTVLVNLPLPPTMPLPIESGHKTRPRARFSKAGASDSAAAVGPIKILVVDDNEAAAQGLGKLLEHHGHQVFLAHDAPEALILAAEHRPNVAILDIGLPSMDGYELARRMRADMAGEITLIALTGYGQSEDKKKAHEAGFEEHLVKPVSIVDVERVLLELRPI